MDAIPMMSVIAGINGIGKSSVLKAIIDRLKDKNICHFYLSNKGEMTSLHHCTSEHDSNISNKISKFTNYIVDRTDPDFIKVDEDEQLYSEFCKFKIEREDNLNQYEIREKRLKLFIHEKNPMNPIFKLHYSHYLKFLDPNKLEILNGFLKKEKFKYILKTKKENSYGNYEYNLENKENEIVHINNMSDGEKMVLTYLMWKFEGYPRLTDKIVYLLDEPDCHLHPGAVQPMIEAVQN